MGRVLTAPLSTALARRCPEFVALFLIAGASLGAGKHDDHETLQRPRSDGFSAATGWKVCLGAAYVDTFPFHRDDVLPVAAQVLAADRWRVQSADALTGRIVTHWQPVRHLFVRLFLGEVRERCVVDVTPMSGQRSVVVFRAGLATRKSIAGSPLMPRVRKEYEEAVRDWQQKVRCALAGRCRK